MSNVNFQMGKSTLIVLINCTGAMAGEYRMVVVREEETSSNVFVVFSRFKSHQYDTRCRRWAQT